LFTLFTGLVFACVVLTIALANTVEDRSPLWFGLLLLAVLGWGIVVAVLIVVWAWRRRRMAASASELGLRFLSRDDSGLKDVPAETRPVPGANLMGGVNLDVETKVENVYAGRWHGLEVRLFEFETKHLPTALSEQRQTTFYSCAVTNRPTGVSAAVVESAALLRHYTDTGDHPYLGVGWPSGLLVRSCRDWLLALTGTWGFRVDDPWVFCYVTPQITSAEQFRSLLTMLEGFVDHLSEPSPPPHVWGGGEVHQRTPERSPDT
jgi:hypothetical protein